MNKVKKWIPPVTLARNNVEVWREICLDVHNNLIEAGLVQTDDTGQLDIDSIDEMPANNIEVGYRVYRWNDAAQSTSPIFMKVGFRTGFVGSSWSGNTLYPKFSTQFSTSTDGAGGMSGPSWLHPRDEGVTGSELDLVISPGTSYCSRNDDNGFFGFVYAAGMYDTRASGSYSAYMGLLNIFIQRDSHGGFSVLGGWNNVGNTTSPNYRLLQFGAGYSFVSPDGSFSTMTRTAAPRPFASVDFNPVNGVNFAPVYSCNSLKQIKQWPSLVTYHNDIIAAGSEFDLEIIKGETKNFIALGNQTGIGVDQQVRGDYAFAMIWEDDE